MADFVQTMKDWRRMCKHYSDESMKDGQHSCAAMCPLGHNNACGMIEDALDSDIEVTEKEIAKWAAEHPEPVYPTWSEWLYEQGVLGDKYVCSIPELIASNVATGKVDDPIPVDIAQRLGLQPKEG